MCTEFVGSHKMQTLAFSIFLTFFIVNVPTITVFPCNTHRFHYNLTSVSKIQNTSVKTQQYVSLKDRLLCCDSDLFSISLFMKATGMGFYKINKRKPN